MQHRAARVPSVMTIAGSDSGGGAGIEADLKTFSAWGIHGVAALTAITAQHTRAVTAVEAVSTKAIAAQIDALFDDFDIRAIKIGMLGDRATIAAVAAALSRSGELPPLVVDPVMVATSGARLLPDDAVSALVSELFPLATLITPNVPEAETLLGHSIRSVRDLPRAATALLALGSSAVLMKGGHLGRGPVRDVLATAAGITRFERPRLRRNGHGTGCTLSAAIAARLAAGVDLAEAVRDAGDYVALALALAYRPGRGAVDVLAHFAAAPVASGSASQRHRRARPNGV